MTQIREDSLTYNLLLILRNITETEIDGIQLNLELNF
jgi:hypothetical protein